MNEYKVTVIMPALNEEHGLSAGIEDVMAGFRVFNISGELIVVNDGSTDSTGRIADDCKKFYSNMNVIHHKSPRGIGAAFRAGVQKAQGEIVVMIPADGENEASEILRYLPLMEEVDIVIPFVSAPEVRTWKRRLLSFLYRKIINVTFGLPVRNVTGTVMYRKAILKDISLKSRGFFFQTELLIKTAGKGYLYKEVPYVLKKRKEGISKSTTFGSLMNIVWSYLSVMLEVYSMSKNKWTISTESKTAEQARKII